MRIPLIMCLLAGVVASGYAQRLHFRTYQDVGADKLLEPSCWLQRTDGSIWIGDQQGLWLFNGLQFTPVATSDSLTGKRVTALYEDPQARLWVGYAHGGIYQLDRQQMATPWQPEEGWPAAAITGFATGAAGYLWWATYGEGVYCRRGDHVYQFAQDDGLPALDIYAIRADAQGRIVVAHDSGISYLGWNKDKKSIINLTKADGLPDDIIRALLPDAHGGCWVGGYEGGVAHVDGTTRQVTPVAAPWPGGTVVGMASFGDNDLWVATDNDGIYHGNAQKNTWETNEVAAWKNTNIQQISADQEGNLWVTCKRQGIASANVRWAFEPHTLPTPQCVTTTADGQTIWVGTAQGLFAKDHTDSPFRAVPGTESLNIISIYRDDQGQLWLGTFGDGCYVRDPQTGQQRQLNEKAGLGNGNILSICGRGGNVWLSTLGGVYALSDAGAVLAQPGARFRALDAPGLGSSFIYCSMVDSRGNVWWGTDGKGLGVMYADGRYANFARHENGDAVGTVYSLAQDGTGTIWASTEAGEVLYLDGELLRVAPFSPNVHKGQFVSLRADAAGTLLMTHARGVDCWNPKTRQMVHYNGAVGLGDFQPALNGLSAAVQGSQYLLSDAYWVRYRTLDGAYRQTPRTQITSVAVFLQPVDFATRTAFGHDENNLVIGFMGYWFTDPEHISFQYMLEGFDQDWIPSDNRQAVYSNLPPGSYTFRVRASANGFFEQADEATYTFRIAKPLWQRVWFMVLALALVAAAIAAFMRRRERRLQREAALVREKIESQFQALKSQINPHFLFNAFNTLVSLVEEQPKQAVAYIEKLSDFYRGILQYRESEVVPLEEELRLLRDYAYLLEHRFGDNFKLDIQVSAAARKVVPFTLQLLVENAVKHNIISKQQPLTVRIRTDADGYLWVENPRQPKRTQEPSTGFGIASIQSQYRLLTSRPVVVDDADGVFRVGIPGV